MQAIAALLVALLPLVAHAEAQIGRNCTPDAVRDYTDNGKGASSMGDLTNTIAYGHCGAWDVVAIEGQLALSNKLNPDRFKVIGHTYGAEGIATASVNVSVRNEDCGGEDCGGGLAFGISSTGNSFFCILIQADGTILLLQHYEGRFRQFAVVPKQPDMDAAHRLVQIAVVTYKNTAEILIDRAVIARVHSPVLNQHGSGIIAIGAGVFIFGDFTISIKS